MKTAIIGAGPAGASAAIYLARFCHDVMLFDAGEKVPGRTSMATHVENFLGLPLPVKGKLVLGLVGQQLKRFGVKPIEAKVTKVTRESEKFTIYTDADKTYDADFVVVAVGLSDTMPEIDGLDDYFDHAIFHCLTCDWYWNRDKKAAVVANTDNGIETALMIAQMHMPPKLSVIPAKKPQFSDDLIAKAAEQGIAVFTSPLKELKGSGGDLDAAILEDGTEVETEVLFTKLGHTRYDTFLDEGGIQVDREPKEDFIKVDWRTFETSVKNMFAVGPCNEGPDQAIIASGEGALAAIEIHRRIMDAPSMTK